MNGRRLQGHPCFVLQFPEKFLFGHEGKIE
jgi:hypothetical protein